MANSLMLPEANARADDYATRVVKIALANAINRAAGTFTEIGTSGQKGYTRQTPNFGSTGASAGTRALTADCTFGPFTETGLLDAAYAVGLNASGDAIMAENLKDSGGTNTTKACGVDDSIRIPSGSFVIDAYAAPA